MREKRVKDGAGEEEVGLGNRWRECIEGRGGREVRTRG